MSTPVAAADTAAPGRPDRLAAFRRWTRPVLVANVVAQIGIIVTGGAVRLTDSGLGCTTWPQCHPGQFTARYHAEASFHEVVEFSNRTLTGVLSVIALAVLLLVWTDRRRPLSYRLLGAVPLAGVAAQAVIGGVVVLLHLHPGWVSLHFGVSAALVWVSAYLLHRYGEGDGPAVPVGPRPVRTAGWAVGLLLVPVVVLGVLVTGSGPHSGDDEVGYRLALDPLATTRLHASAVWLFVAAVGVLLFLLHRLARDDAGRVGSARRAGWILLAVTLAQGGIGYAQYFTGLPELLVGLHMLGAGVLVWAAAHAVLHLRTRA